MVCRHKKERDDTLMESVSYGKNMYKEIKINATTEEEFCRKIRENARRAGYYETLPLKNVANTLCFTPSNNSTLFARMYDPFVTIDYSFLDNENKIIIRAELDRRVHIYVIIICIILAINIVRCFFGNEFSKAVCISYVSLSLTAAVLLLANIRHNRKRICTLFLESILG